MAGSSPAMTRPGPLAPRMTERIARHASTFARSPHLNAVADEDHARRLFDAIGCKAQFPIDQAADKSLIVHRAQFLPRMVAGFGKEPRPLLRDVERAPGGEPVGADIIGE